MNDVLRVFHGANPEHALILDWETIAAAPEDDYLERRIREWVESIHAFECDGIWVGQPE